MCYGILNNYYFKIITVVEIKIQLNGHSHPATFHTLRLEEIWQIIWTHFENTFKKLNGIEISPQTILIRDRFSQQLKRIERLLLGLRASNPLALTSQVLVTASSFMHEKTETDLSQEACSKSTFWSRARLELAPDLSGFRTRALNSYVINKRHPHARVASASSAPGPAWGRLPHSPQASFSQHSVQGIWRTGSEGWPCQQRTPLGSSPIFESPPSSCVEFSARENRVQGGPEWLSAACMSLGD